MLAHPREDRPFYIMVDGSTHGLGACLFQPRNWWEYQVVAYWSRSLTPAASNYSSRELECLALIGVLMKYGFLIPNKVHLITDHARPWSAGYVPMWVIALGLARGCCTCRSSTSPSFTALASETPSPIGSAGPRSARVPAPLVSELDTSKHDRSPAGRLAQVPHASASALQFIALEASDFDRVGRHLLHTSCGVIVPELGLEGVVSDRLFNGAVAPVSCMGGEGQQPPRKECNNQVQRNILSSRRCTSCFTTRSHLFLTWGVMVSSLPGRNVTNRCNGRSCLPAHLLGKL